MVIKICGITNIDEVNALNFLKPEYVGFVFAESKRKVTIDTAKKLYNSLNKKIKIVGVFRNNSEEEILQVLKNIPLDVIQLHGMEDELFIRKIKRRTTTEIWKAIGIQNELDIEKALKYSVDTLVLDGSNPGSGEAFSWEILKDRVINKKVILAGGLNLDNVLEGIEAVKPYGIDVSSGVESIDLKGNRYKDKNKMEKLINKVRESNER
ncbi:MAG: phosphoribosylanthranilate isomerase [Clostridiales bacterium]|nr:phosphoribosylanthranilate isomerase [Clostridiales bacterium]